MNTKLRELHLWLRRGWIRESLNWVRCPRVSVPNVKQITEAIAALEDGRVDHLGNDAEAPIFLLGTGWRTGSTLLQRILVTDPQLLLWGEPFGEMTPVTEMARMIFRMSNFPGLKARYAEEVLVSSSMATSWIGTLYPPPQDFRSALRSLLGRWLGEPARRRGFIRWGLKEVRLGATEAVLLRWLYPRAKFVALTRHPFDCYLSLSDSGWHHVYFRRPDVRVDSAAGFARHWNRLALSWSEVPPEFPVFRVKYEDIVNRQVDFRKLEDWLGLKLNEGLALSALVSHTAARQQLSWHQRLIISLEARSGMVALGYSQRSEKADGRRKGPACSANRGLARNSCLRMPAKE